MMPTQDKPMQILNTILADQNLNPALKSQVEELRNSLQPIFTQDIWIYRAVVGVLGITVLATVLGGLWLANKGDVNKFKLPAEIVAVGSAAVGALAGLLAPSPLSGKG